MRNTSELDYCFGCGVCATTCPKNIISIVLSDEGFYVPRIVEQDICVECGTCMKVCAFLHKEISQPKEIYGSWASWSKDIKVRQKASSGGVGLELGFEALDNNNQVCGVRYNVEKGRAEHFIATSKEEIIQTTGSKYIQSYTIDGFKDIDLKKNYLVTGTPCQIDSFRRYLQMRHKEDNFLLMDFFCHGVPSMLMWKKYCQLNERKIGKLIYLSWRDKQTGWHDSWSMDLEGKNGKIKTWFSKGDIFYKLFLGDYCMNKACFKDCKYKYDNSAADIRIGDFWGDTYAKDEDGVSALIAFTSKGKNVIEKLEDRCQLIEHPFEIVAEGQMQNNCGVAFLSPIAWNLLKSSKFVSSNKWNLLFKCEAVLHLPQRIIRKMIKIIKVEK